MDKKRIEILFREILLEIGEDPNREGLKETPSRVAKMYTQIFRGYDQAQIPTLKKFHNHRDGISCNGLIIDCSYFFSSCEHHALPFFGDYYFGYIPNNWIVGTSKIARLIDFYAAKLQVQERLCSEVVDEIEREIRPKGCILVMSARHLCKEMRGVQKTNSPFETIEARGVLLANEEGCKDEFIARIGVRHER